MAKDFSCITQLNKTVTLNLRKNLFPFYTLIFISTIVNTILELIYLKNITNNIF